RVQEPEPAVRARRLSGERLLVVRDRRHQPDPGGRTLAPAGSGDGRHLARRGAARHLAATRARGIPHGTRGHGRAALAGGPRLLDPAGHAARHAGRAAQGGGDGGAGPGATPVIGARFARGAAALALAATLARAPEARAQSDSKTPPPTPSSTTPSGNPSPPAAHVHVYGQVYVGDRAPDYTLDGSDGKVVRLSRFRGDWVV